VEEVAGQHGRGLGVQESPPRAVVAAHWCGRNPQPLKYPADRRRLNTMTEAEEFALDALVTPPGVVAGHLLDQRGDGRIDRRASRPVRVSPVFGDESPMPPQDRGGVISR
jgi:hypothetical protein